MEEKTKNRLGILRVYADLDAEYQKLKHEIARLEAALLFLSWEDSPKKVKAIRSVINAYNAANRRLLELACKYMIFRSETEQK